MKNHISPLLIGSLVGVVALGSLYIVLTKNQRNTSTMISGPLVAFRQGGNILQTGDLWISESDGKRKKQLTSRGDIDEVYGWSPDNRYIAVSVREDTNPNALLTNRLAVVDAHTGEVMQLNATVKHTTQPVYWDTADRLLYFTDNKLNALTISSNLESDVATIPREAQDMSNLQVSPNREMVSYTVIESVGEVSPYAAKDYVYHLKTEQEQLVLNSSMGSMKGWHGDRVVYLLDKVLYDMSPDGTDKKKLTTIDNNVSRSLVGSADGKKIFYTADTQPPANGYGEQLSLYDYELGTAMSLMKSDENMYFNALASTDKGDLLAFDWAGIVNGAAQVLNPQTKVLMKLCDTACYMPHWSHEL